MKRVGEFIEIRHKKISPTRILGSSSSIYFTMFIYSLDVTSLSCNLSVSLSLCDSVANKSNHGYPQVHLAGGRVGNPLLRHALIKTLLLVLLSVTAIL